MIRQFNCVKDFLVKAFTNRGEHTSKFELKTAALDKAGANCIEEEIDAILPLPSRYVPSERKYTSEQ